MDFSALDRFNSVAVPTPHADKGFFAAISDGAQAKSDDYLATHGGLLVNTLQKRRSPLLEYAPRKGGV